ncbi:MAG: hypothetical protein AB1726_04850 [Planctomycetota bacterium]
MEAWRLVVTWDAAPGFNMALDEAFLRAGEPRPTLRFYTWRPDTLSLGYFQRWADLAGQEQAGAVVRRLTGGGAIHHAAELTFSIAASAAHPLFQGEVRASYERIHDALAAALLPLGVAAARRGERPVASDDPRSAMCFRHSTAVDLVWNGAKGVGSAQRRTGGRVLHHGSIKIGTTPIEGPIATLGARVPDLDPRRLASLLETALAARWGASFRREDPSPAELEHALARASFYSSPAHLRRR